MATKRISEAELDAKMKESNGKNHPEVGAAWRAQTADLDEAKRTDNAAASLLETVTAPDENAIDLDAFADVDGSVIDDALLPPEATYEKGEGDEERTFVDFPKVSVTVQLQNVSYRPRSNGLGIFMQFETDLEVAPSIARIKGADLVFDKLLLGKGANMTGLSVKPDADGNLHTRITLMLPESELMRADPRPLIRKTAVLTLEPAQLEFDLTKRAE